MKQCPACQESFDNELNFCDIDGTPLVDETTLLRAALQPPPIGIGAQITQNGRLSLSSTASTIVIGVLIGIVLCLAVYAVSLARVQNAEPRSQSKSTSEKQQFASPRSAQVASALRPQATPAASPDSQSASPDPDLVPDQKAPEARATPMASPPLVLNNGPVSTGGKQSGERGRAVIKLKDGASVEVDAAWEDGKGVWYRQGGLVSFVEHDRVEAITEPAQPKPPSNDVVKP